MIRQKQMIKTGLPAAVAFGCLLAQVVGAQEAQMQPAAPAKLEIIECLVYSPTDETKRHDCTAKARELCTGGTGSCELPIGLVLSDGRDLDGNSATWEKVRVTFRCGQIKRVNGPHDQNDHASALLACGGA